MEREEGITCRVGALTGHNVLRRSVALGAHDTCGDVGILPFRTVLCEAEIR